MSRFLISLKSICIFRLHTGTKREAELDDISPSKLKTLKTANGKNGEIPSAVDDGILNRKNGEEHYQNEDDDDDDVR